jgi:hypothetical protein
VFDCHGSLSSLKLIGEAKRSLPRQRNRRPTRFSCGGKINTDTWFISQHDVRLEISETKSGLQFSEAACVSMAI